MIYNKDDNSLRGKNIYVDKKKRTIYYNKRSQKGYVITPGSEKSFQVWSSRFILAVICAVFLELFFFNGNWVLSIAIGVGAFAFLEYKYRKLLNSFPMIQNFDTSTAKPTEEADISNAESQLVLKAVLYLALGILLIVNIYVSKDVGDNITMVVVSYAASAFAFYMSIKFLLLILKKKKQK